MFTVFPTPPMSGGVSASAQAVSTSGGVVNNSGLSGSGEAFAWASKLMRQKNSLASQRIRSLVVEWLSLKETENLLLKLNASGVLQLDSQLQDDIHCSPQSPSTSFLYPPKSPARRLSDSSVSSIKDHSRTLSTHSIAEHEESKAGTVLDAIAEVEAADTLPGYRKDGKQLHPSDPSFPTTGVVQQKVSLMEARKYNCEEEMSQEAQSPAEKLPSSTESLHFMSAATEGKMTELDESNQIDSADFVQIPRFYEPPGRPRTLPRHVVDFLDRLFRRGDIEVETLEYEIVDDLLGLPRYFSHCIYRQIMAPEERHVTLRSTVAREKLERWLKSRTIIGKTVETFFQIVKDEMNDAILPEDFQPFLQELLDRHPGLEFLRESADFQARYCDSVTVRIFYSLDPHNNGRITVRELGNSVLTQIWKSLENEPELNSIRHFFSYEHFYVVYCKFWELDTDRDFRLDKQDLMRYDSHAFSSRAVNRLFDPTFNTFLSGCPSLMGYQDFLYLIMNDEDKSTDHSLEFWFRLVDLDGDGVIRYHELWYFYEEQCQRLASFGQEAVPMQDIIYQMNDMLQPERDGEFMLNDFKRHRSSAGSLFNMLFSLTKFLNIENRDLYQMRADVVEYPHDTDWDRFCRLEYERMSTEDANDGNSYTLGSYEEDTAVLLAL